MSICCRPRAPRPTRAALQRAHTVFVESSYRLLLVVLGDGTMSGFLRQSKCQRCGREVIGYQMTQIQRLRHCSPLDCGESTSLKSRSKSEIETRRRRWRVANAVGADPP